MKISASIILVLLVVGTIGYSQFKVKNHMDNGQTLTITAKNQSKRNVYVKRVMLNRNELKNHTISHQQMMNGGELLFEMSGQPKR